MSDDDDTEHPMRRRTVTSLDKGQLLYSHDEVSNHLDGKVGTPRWRGRDPDSNCIISLAVLMKAGYDVRFRVGLAKNAKGGGILHTPDGKQITLTFEDNMPQIHRA